jgi:acyl-CoA synthetase (AMP-forming)/AMP-acid ligase II
LNGRSFPFGIEPELSALAGDDRGPDTVNRLLLHGARYHDRTSVFVSPELGETPDWRADRTSIRIALALREDLQVGPGDRVGLLLPLSVRWALLERAVWGLGAATVPLPETSKSDRHLKAVFSADLDWDALLERGGVLDTPERASWFRAVARDVAPEAVASIESGFELRHEEWVLRVERFLARFPPERGRRNLLAIREPLVAARALVYAGWTDGLTTLVFGAEDPAGGSECRLFATLSDLSGEF